MMPLIFALLPSVCLPHFVGIFIPLTKDDGSNRLLWQVVCFKVGNM